MWATPWAPWALFGIRRHRPLDDRPRRRKLPVLGQGQGVIRAEPEIVAVVRGEAVHQHRDLALLADAAGAADQAVGVRRTGERPAHRAATPPDGDARRRSRPRSRRQTRARSRRCGSPRARTRRKRGPWRWRGPPALPRRRPVSAGPAPCRRGPGQNRDRRRWPGHRPRAHRDRTSAPDRRPGRRHPARQPTSSSRQGRSDPSA